MKLLGILGKFDITDEKIRQEITENLKTCNCYNKTIQLTNYNLCIHSGEYLKIWQNIMTGV